MKVALLLHGLTRRYDMSFPFIKENIIDKLNADTFISCWDNQVKEEEIGKGENLNLKKMINLYNPTRYDEEIYNEEIEKNFTSEKYLNIFNQPQVHYKNNWSRLFAFYYKVWKSNELKSQYEFEKNFKYDVVIKWRTDVLIKDVLTKELLNEIKNDNNSIYMPFGHCGETNDMVYMANSNTMDKICKLYYNLEIVADKIAPEPSYEKHLLTWINMNNINIKYFNINWQFLTFRPEFKIRTLNIDNILNSNV